MDTRSPKAHCVPTRGVFADMARNTQNEHSASDTCPPKDVSGPQGSGRPKSKYPKLFEHFPSSGTGHAHPSTPGKYGDQGEPSRTHHHRVQPSPAALQGAEHHSQDGTGYAQDAEDAHYGGDLFQDGGA